MENELTEKEIERLDFIQNETHDFIERLVKGGAELETGEWDMDLIDLVLETVWEGIKDKGILPENEFYPFRETP